MQARSDGSQQLVEAIEAYLLTHPEAADSECGIAEWWLPELGVSAPVEQVRRALETCCERGTVRSQTMRDGRVIYRANKNTDGMKN